MSRSPPAPVRDSIPTSWRPRSNVKAFIDGRLGYSSVVGVLMAAIMVLFGLVYLRVIAQRKFGEAV